MESIQRHITKYICIKQKYNLSYTDRLSVLNLSPAYVRNDLKMLTLLFKSMYNYNNVLLIWKNMFNITETRNGLIVKKPYTRLKFCDKNFFKLLHVSCTF